MIGEDGGIQWGALLLYALSLLMSLCYVNIYHKNVLFGGRLKVIVLYCIVLYCTVLYYTPISVLLITEVGNSKKPTTFKVFESQIFHFATAIIYFAVKC